MVNPKPFSCFAVVIVGTQIWAITRGGVDAGNVGLPGGKRDTGETPVFTASREAAEAGLHVHGVGKLLHTAQVDGNLVHWYQFSGATPLLNYKEKHRGIRAVLVDRHVIANSGYENSFLLG